MTPQYIEITSTGSKFYFKDKDMTILHREDGPAIEYTDGSTEWWLNGELHREDGPACEYTDGDKYWFINGHRLSETEFNAHEILYN